MAIPSVKLTVQDGGLGLLPQDTSAVQVKIGTSSRGPLGELRSFSNVDALRATFGAGPLVEAAAHVLQVAGGPVFCLRVPSHGGTVAPATTNPTTPAVAAAGAPHDAYQLAVRVVRTGALGAGEFVLSIDGGNSWSAPRKLPASGELEVEDTGVTLQFAEDEYAEGVYEFACIPPAPLAADVESAFAALFADSREWAWAHVIGSNPPAVGTVTKSRPEAPDVEISGTPVGHHRVQIEVLQNQSSFSEVTTTSAPAPDVLFGPGPGEITQGEPGVFLVEITEGGPRGFAKFRWSKNGGSTWEEEEVTVPSGGEYISASDDALKFVFSPGVYRSGDLFSVQLDRVVNYHADGGSPDLGYGGSTSENIEVIVEVTHDGGRGTGHFHWTLDNEEQGDDHVAKLAISDATGGTFVLEIDGQSTAPIAYDANAAAVKAAIEDVTGADTVEAGSGTLGTDELTLTFGGNMAGRYVEIVVDDDDLEGEGAAATVTTETPGGEQIPAVDGEFVLGDTGLVITFPDDTFAVGNRWVFTSDVVPVSGTLAGDDTIIGEKESAPVGELSLDGAIEGEVEVRVTSAGGRGTAQVAATVNGESRAIGLLPESGSFTIATGLIGTLPDTVFRAGDKWEFSGTAPTIAVSVDDGEATELPFTPGQPVPLPVASLSVTLPETGLELNDRFTFDTYTASVAAARALADTVAALMQTARTAHGRYVFTVLEVPPTPDDALVDAFDDFVDPEARVAVGAGQLWLTSAVTPSRAYLRNTAWSATARAALVPLHEDLGRVASGALSGARFVPETLPQLRVGVRDERATPGLDEARFITGRTHLGLQGYYLTNGRLMSTADSDFRYLQHRRVMDRACRVADTSLLQYLNETVTVDPETGFIDETDAVAIEAQVERALLDALRASIVSVEVQVKRDEPILTTSKLPARMRIVPFGYAKFIEAEIGFRNPAAQ